MCIDRGGSGACGRPCNGRHLRNGSPLRGSFRRRRGIEGHVKGDGLISLFSRKRGFTEKDSNDGRSMDEGHRRVTCDMHATTIVGKGRDGFG